MSIKCGNRSHDKFLAKEHHHESVAQVRHCYEVEGGIWSIEEEDHASWNSYLEDDPDVAYERHLENACWEEHRAFEAWEAARGVVDVFAP